MDREAESRKEAEVGRRAAWGREPAGPQVAFGHV